VEQQNGMTRLRLAGIALLILGVCAGLLTALGGGMPLEVRTPPVRTNTAGGGMTFRWYVIPVPVQAAGYACSALLALLGLACLVLSFRQRQEDRDAESFSGRS
jgi:hypothetical protein